MAASSSDELARVLSDLQKRVRTLERASRLERSSVMVGDGLSVDVPRSIAEASPAAWRLASALADLVRPADVAAGAVTVYYDRAAASAPAEGDLLSDASTWVLYRREGGVWSPLGDQSLAADVAVAGEEAAAADGFIRSYWSATEPVQGAHGDLWFRTDTGNEPHRWDTSGWMSLAVQSERIAEELVGKTITGSRVRTASGGSRIELDDDGGLAAYRDDGSTSVRVTPRTDVIGPGSRDGLLLGTDAVLRFGAGQGGSLFKDAADPNLAVRSTTSLGTGAGIVLSENARDGTDGDGDVYAGSAHFWAGGAAVLKLLASGVARFTGGIWAPGMRMYSDEGGSADSWDQLSWKIQLNTPVVFFVAPPSGVVKIELSASLSGSIETATARADVATRLGTVAGQGSDLYAPLGILSLNGTRTQRGSGLRLLSDLTPGETYYCRTVFSSAVAGVSVNIGSSLIIITPSM